MKIVFMGTPDFAKNILQGLVEAGHEVTGVYTQPDKPKGRSGQPVPSPVKEYAQTVGIAVYQPEKIKKEEEVALLKTIPADIFVVAAYGQILSQKILDIPKFGCINAHGSLLPKYRGSSPIQRAIANGDEKTGVTLMKMDKGMDSGDIIAMSEIKIEDADNEITMYDKLSFLAKDLVLEYLPLIESGKATYTPQNADEVTFAPMLKKEDGLLSFDLPARLLDCKVRGFLAWPTAYMYFGGKLLKIYRSAVRGKDEFANITDELANGTFVKLKKNLLVATSEGFLELLEVQPEGKKRMPAMDFANGCHIETGMKIGL